MFKKILVANRGEIALRVLCACKELDIRTVAVYSEADEHSLAVRFADEAVCIGPPRPSASYLNIPSVISAAAITGADAIHPGYGFLSEDANFAEVCETSGVTFIGPSPDQIRLMADKTAARRRMQQEGIPVVPGSDGVLDSADEAADIARTVGYPILLKSARGGGGRGIRIARERNEVASAFDAARREALQAFGSEELYLEKLIPEARHIEFQVLVDQSGEARHLGERECSMQRHYQKILEESPSPGLLPEKRSAVGALVESALSRIGYLNAGTVEFLMDERGELCFLEMNTRIQVEHPVTEMVTGIDLVKSQILLAAGAPVPEVANGELALRGHGIECRINAEDPVTFAPSSGHISSFHVPGGTGVRVDTASYTECSVHPYYDSLVAKLIVHGRTRKEALSRMSRALEMFIVEGIQTTIPLHRKILADPDFQRGNYNSRFLERFRARPALAAH